MIISSLKMRQLKPSELSLTYLTIPSLLQKAAAKPFCNSFNCVDSGV